MSKRKIKYFSKTDPRMLTAFHHIVEMLSPYPNMEKIFLLAEQTTYRSSHAIFSERVVTETRDKRVLLLILTNELSSNKATEAFIHSRVDDSPQIVAWILKAAAFTKALEEKHPFALTVNAAGHLLYSASPENAASIPPILNYEKKFSGSWLNRCSEFLAGTELYLVRKQPKMAAFCLHQAAEQAFCAIIVNATGLHPETHNLARLNLFAGFFCHGLSSIFPSHSNSDDSTFRELQKAYIDARYSDHFYLDTEKLHILNKKIVSLYEIAKAEAYSKPVV